MVEAGLGIAVIPQSAAAAYAGNPRFVRRPLDEPWAARELRMYALRKSPRSRAVAALIEPSVTSIVVLIAVASWMEVARVVEGQIRSLRERDFALAAESLGASDSRIMFRELLPNAVAPIVVAATLNIAHAILAESYISFLGFGIQPPTPSWGNMLENAQSYLTNAPWLAIVPGLAITLTVTSFNFIGDGLRDALDAKLDR